MWLCNDVLDACVLAEPDAFGVVWLVNAVPLIRWRKEEVVPLLRRTIYLNLKEE